jgi:RNA polymerase sigma factor (sigma-70 family)
MPQPAETQLASFPATRWTLIRRVQKGDERDARKAMEEICRQYWYPLYAFARHRGFSAEDAEDLTQELFRRVITGETIQAARQEHGLMRSFLLSLLKKVISNHLRDATAQKRGGSETATISFNDLEAEGRYAHEPADISDAETLFDRAWAQGVLDAAEKKLRESFAEGNNLDGYDQLREFLPLGDNVTPYEDVARKLNISESALRQQISRVRKRYARLIEHEIAQTVSSPAEVKAELEHLMAVVGR